MTEAPSQSQAPFDAAFEKYAKQGAYHWRMVGNNLLHHHAFTAERYRRAIAAAGSKIQGRVLDYGSGDGALLSWIAGRAQEAHGFDPSPGINAVASELLRKAELLATLHESPDDIPDGYFDVVICADVIEHVLDVPALLANITSKLKPDGVAVITTPIRLLEHSPDPNHVQEWFPEEFVALFNDGPLEVVTSEQFIPRGAGEAYYWRPFRLPILRLICNFLSIRGHNALTALGFPPRFMSAQLVAARPRQG